MTAVLIKPTTLYAKEFGDMLAEFREHGLRGHWTYKMDTTDVYALIDRSKDFELGRNLPEKRVQATTYWLVDNGRCLGSILIRHVINENLLTVGGGISYIIRPSEWGKGYGTMILSQALQKAKDIGLKKILVNCLDSNIPSRKIIEKNGGVFQDMILNKKGQPKRRYYIDLSTI